MKPPFHENPSFQNALQRAQKIAADISAQRNYFIVDDVASIIATHVATVTTLGKMGRLPVYQIINDIAVWPVADFIGFLRCPESWRAAQSDLGIKPQRLQMPLCKTAPKEIALSGTRTRTVLALLKTQPRTTAELAREVGAGVNGIIYRLRKQGHRIVARRTFIVDDCGHPHRGVALYTLVEAEK